MGPLCGLPSFLGVLRSSVTWDMDAAEPGGMELSCSHWWFVIAHQSQYLLPGWLCLAPEDQPACVGAVLCSRHPSVSTETPSGTLPSLLPLRYPHQAAAATHTRKCEVISKELNNGTETPAGLFLQDRAVAKPKSSDKTIFISLLDLDPSLQAILGLL